MASRTPEQLSSLGPSNFDFFSELRDSVCGQPRLVTGDFENSGAPTRTLNRREKTNARIRKKNKQTPKKPHACHLTQFFSFSSPVIIIVEVSMGRTCLRNYQIALSAR